MVLNDLACFGYDMSLDRIMFDGVIHIQIIILR